jgi:hypothetical protein
MLAHFVLPRLYIAGKLYGAIALTLVVVYALAAGTARFARETERAVAWVEDEALQAMALVSDVEAGLRRQRELIASLPGVPDAAARARSEQAFGDLAAKISGTLALMDRSAAGELSPLFARLRTDGASVFKLAAKSEHAAALVAGGQFARTAAQWSRTSPRCVKSASARRQIFCKECASVRTRSCAGCALPRLSAGC